MKKSSSTRTIPWVSILAIGFTLALFGNILFAYNAFERTRVVDVPDGDSLDLADGRRVRLLGIDAPEKGRCMAGEARIKLVELAQGKHVRLKDIVKDAYGRQLAIVIVEEPLTWLSYLQWRFLASIGSRPGLERGNYPEPDPLLQRTLLSAGLARNRSAVGNPYHQVLVDAQEAAKANKLGIWSDRCRGETSGREDCTIKGNIRAGEDVYYLPSCKAYDAVIVDRAFGDEWFCSEKEAHDAGFQKATSCQ
ncbi:hypothetical protein A2973_04620 [Candidatus Gottesmanbacteria bacterium RIFCSPLOWO2_01_FULL_49_10]|uniref:TNase-like domain-containing protein n=1 Tax=Candidatus Gottesmanbacteria bacterium RIFCSPLOWO2_01_FULL_49_10 TaxID=1798396 RepID=A0A1F6AZS9_9BACT|nr:MAG: hypothetical protein A2973_04620 [Candidatus Gottesmanbacteria bacterium RIFCSPLOWO2_01_FULL_49_10]